MLLFESSLLSAFWNVPSYSVIRAYPVSNFEKCTTLFRYFSLLCYLELQSKLPQVSMVLTVFGPVLPPRKAWLPGKTLEAIPFKLHMIYLHGKMFWWPHWWPWVKVMLPRKCWRFYFFPDESWEPLIQTLKNTSISHYLCLSHDQTLKELCWKLFLANFYPSGLQAEGILSYCSGGWLAGRAGGWLAGSRLCGTHISETARWIFSIRSSMELSGPEVVQRHVHLPICPIRACPFALCSNLASAGSRFYGTHIWNR